MTKRWLLTLIAFLGCSFSLETFAATDQRVVKKVTPVPNIIVKTVTEISPSSGKSSTTTTKIIRRVRPPEVTPQVGPGNKNAPPGVREKLQPRPTNLPKGSR